MNRPTALALFALWANIWPSECRGEEVRVLANLACPVSETETVFLLAEEEVDPEVKRGLYLRTVLFSVERVVGGTEGGGEVIWRNATSYMPGIFPWPVWRGDMVCDFDSGNVHVVLVFNRGVSAMTLDLYTIPGEQAALGMMKILDAKRLPNAPDLKLPSRTRYSADLPFEGGGVKKLETRLDGRLLAIDLIFENEKVDPLQLSIDLRSGEVRPIHEGGDAESPGTPKAGSKEDSTL